MDTPRTDAHYSDCATHNEPAMRNGPCDCGLVEMMNEPKYVFSCLRPDHVGVYDDHVLASDFYRIKKKLERELAASQEKVKRLREVLEFWIYDGHLQTFEDRERFRKAARATLEATK